MDKWKYKVNIKQHLTDDKSWEGIALASNSIAKELKTIPSSIDEYLELSDIIKFLEGLCLEDVTVYKDEQEMLEEFDFQLNELYNFADYNHVLLG